MRLLYSIGIYCYQALIWLFSLFSQKAKLWVKGRKNWKEQLSSLRNSKVIWIHAASLGEFEQGKPVLENLKKDYPSHKILLTFFSPSGYEVRKNYNQADLVMYLPADTISNAKYFVDQLDIQLALFIKYEFWFNYLHVLENQNIPTLFFSVIFREDQLFFKKYGSWFAKHLLFVDHFFVQNAVSKKLLEGIGMRDVTIAGDTRFDAVHNTYLENKEFAEIANFCKGNKVVICGSTWLADHQLILPFIAESAEEVKFIIAPHEIKQQQIDDLVNDIDDVGKFSSANFSSKKVLIIDQIGILKHLYKYCEVSYIGGGFGAGIHNTLEAIAARIPVVFGPKYQKFQEAVELIDLKMGKSISNQKELSDCLNYFLEDPEVRAEVADISASYISRNLGATKLIGEKVAGVL